MPIAQTRGQAEDWGDRDAPADERGVARRDAVDDAGARRGPGEDGEGDEAGRVLLERQAEGAEVEAAGDEVAGAALAVDRRRSTRGGRQGQDQHGAGQRRQDASARDARAVRCAGQRRGRIPESREDAGGG